MLLVAVAGAIGVYPLLSTVAARGSSGALVVADPIGKPQLLSVSDAQGELVSEQASRIARFGIPRAPASRQTMSRSSSPATSLGEGSTGSS